MNIDIGRVFANTFAMVRERWGPMLGLWATFFAALIVYFMIFGGLLGGSAFLLGSAMGGDGFGDDPLAGMGIGFFLMILVFYVGYFAIAFGQQGSMIAMASPFRRPTFGEAFSLGLKGGLSFLGVVLVLIVAYIVLALIGALFVAMLGEVGGIILAILVLPVAIYIGCRFAVLVPVIVVEGVFNPIKAITRTWEVTRGKALGIFVIYLIFTVVAGIALMLPFGIFFGSIYASIEAGADPGIGSVLFMGLLFMLVFIAFMLITASMVASLHAEISDSQAEDLSETFG
ncbi:MAG: hypothetical protein QNJ15_05250 [Erythrobacter sp.]|nr:hypothetical protein [Erythrobacter sp.]